MEELNKLKDQLGLILDQIEKLSVSDNFTSEIEEELCLLYTSPSPRDS